VSGSIEPPQEPKRRKSRRLLVVLVVVVIVGAGLLAALFVPYNSESKEIQVTSSSGTSTTLSLPDAAWVTVHFEHPGPMAMAYWMNGPGGSMMFHHGGMMGGDSYSFWSNGGDFQCGAGYEETGQGMTPVWVNATWGLL